MSDTVVGNPLDSGNSPDEVPVQPASQSPSKYLMRRVLTNKATLILSLFGIVLTTILTIEEQGPAQILPCSTRYTSCEGAFHSSYGHLGPIPTALFGVVTYVLLAAMAWRRKGALASIAAGTTPEDAGLLKLRPLDMAVWFVLVASICVSWWLQYIAIFVIASFCPYCFTSAITLTILFFVAYHDYVLAGRPIPSDQKMVFAVLGFLGVGLGFIYIPEIILRLQVANDMAPKSVSVTLRSLLINSQAPSEGNPNAKYVVVEFADYGCPHCAQAAKRMPALLKANPDIRLIFRNYPLGMNSQTGPRFPNSVLSAQAALAAGLQGKFWQMHDMIYQDQDQVSNHNFSGQGYEQLASSLGLNTHEFGQDMQSPAIAAEVTSDFEAGNQARVSSTPTFFLVTPNKITSFIGDDELAAILKNRKDPAWK